VALAPEVPNTQVGSRQIYTPDRALSERRNINSGNAHTVWTPKTACFLYQTPRLGSLAIINPFIHQKVFMTFLFKPPKERTSCPPPAVDNTHPANKNSSLLNRA